MKLALPVKLTALTTIVLTSLFGSAPPVRANDYGEREVNQNQFIAVAVPFGQRQYNLIVLEQIPGQAVCWSESGSQPVIVEPLLLKFDFTGSCRRATDSNGYSIRLNGQDYGLNYLLSIVERSGELFLVGTPRAGERHRAEILVGRSYGLNQGWHKILLNPGWRFTKRTYQTKTLGHIYLTSSQEALNYSVPVTAETRPTQTTTERELIYTAPNSSDPNSNRNNSTDWGADKLLVPDIPIPVSTQN